MRRAPVFRGPIVFLGPAPGPCAHSWERSEHRESTGSLSYQVEHCTSCGDTRTVNLQNHPVSP